MLKSQDIVNMLKFSNKDKDKDDAQLCEIGPSGVRALPLAAGINVVAIVLGIIFLLPSPLLFYQKGGR